MADSKISALTQGTPATTDILPYVDLTAGATKKTLVSSLVPNFVDNEVVSGSGTSFTLANTPVTGSEKLYALGQRLTGGGTDYTISGQNITTVNSWTTGQILADYRK